MITLSIPQAGDKILFEAILEPTESAVDKLKKSKDVGEGEITTFRNKVNRVAVGEPYYEDLISRLEGEKEIPHEIERLLDDYDFHFVSLSCSFLPDTGCRFAWARFGIELNAQLESGDSQEKPIAFDMFPDEILSEIAYKRDFTFKAGLKFKLGPIESGTDGGVKTQEEYIIYEPHIVAFGINRSTVAWNFENTKEKGIWGNKRGLLLVVKAPKNSKVKGRFLLGAEVEYELLKGVRLSFSKRKDKVVDKEYNLSG
jgi:hypothetical protein